jgi:antitoxin ParD1/3/4
MNISLTPELEKFISGKVESGMYHTASEVVREGLRLLKEKDELHQRKLDELRAAIQEGIDQAELGQVSPFNQGTLQEVKQLGREKLADKRRAKA